MIKVIKIRDNPEIKDIAARWYHEKWGIPLSAYEESISACLACRGAVPQWYIYVDEDGSIAAGAGVIENDFHKRPDLTPNVCAVYVEKPYRKKGLAREMLTYIAEDMADFGIKKLYLLTDHTEFYEKCGWNFLCIAEENSGGFSRVYEHEVK